jgi:hypothetical protein
MAAAAKAADMTAGPAPCRDQIRHGGSRPQDPCMVHAVWIATETTMAEATVIRTGHDYKNRSRAGHGKVMPVMEIAAMERIVIVPIVGVGAMGKMAVISIAAIACAGRQARGQTCKRAPSPPAFLNAPSSAPSSFARVNSLLAITWAGSTDGARVVLAGLLPHCRLQEMPSYSVSSSKPASFLPSGLLPVLAVAPSCWPEH